jgi:hypothetical protein
MAKFFRLILKKLEDTWEDDGDNKFLKFTLIFVIIGFVQQAISSGFGVLTYAAPQGIVSLQTAWSIETAQAILRSWDSHAQKGVYLNLVIDTFFFIPTYIALLFGMCKWAIGHYSSKNKVKKYGNLLICAGVSDILENVCLVTMIAIYSNGHNFGEWLSILTSVWCILKLTIILAALIYCFFAALQDRYAHGFYHLVRLVGVSIIIPMVAFAVLTFNQGLEALRVLAEDMLTMSDFVSVGRAVGRLTLAIVSGLFLASMVGFWARLLIARLYKFQPIPSNEKWAAEYLPRACAAATLFVIALGCIEAAAPQGTNHVPVPMGEKVILYFMGTPAMIGSVIAFIIHKKIKTPKKLDPNELVRISTNEKGLINNLGFRLSLLTLIVIFAVNFILAGPANALFTCATGPVFWLFMGLSMILITFSIVVLQGVRTGLPLIYIPLIAYVFISALDLGDNHRVRITTAPDTNHSSTHQTTDEATTFNAWLTARADRSRYNKDHPYPVFFVAAEGGGIRAAYQTTQTLAAIQQENPAFAQHLFAISSVSGGSVGAAVFTAMADRFASNTNAFPKVNEPVLSDDKHDLTWPDVSNRILGHDLLSPVISGTFTGNFLQRFIPISLPWTDQSRGLEYALEWAWADGTQGVDQPAARNALQNHHGVSGGMQMLDDHFEPHKFQAVDSKQSIQPSNPFQRSFYTLASDLENKATPALFLNTTCVETGDRMVIAALRPANPNGGTRGFKVDDDGFVNGLPSIYDLHLLAGVAPDEDIELSTAACLSARFPLFLSAGWIAERKLPKELHSNAIYPRAKRRYVDGGYFENSGVTTLLDIMHALKVNEKLDTMSLTTLGGQTIWWQPIIITLNSDPPSSQDALKSLNGLQFTNRPLAEAWDVLAPIQGAVAGFSQHNSDNLSRLRSQFSPEDHLRTGSQKRYLPFHFQGYSTTFPLGWLLSKKMRGEMEWEIGSPSDCLTQEYRKTKDYQDNMDREKNGSIDACRLSNKNSFNAISTLLSQ